MKSKFVYVLFLVLIVLSLLYPYLSINNSRHSGDWRISHQNSIIIMNDAFVKGELPLWTSLVDSGMPFFAIPDKPLLYPLMFSFLLIFGPIGAMNILFVFHAILGVVGMFFLVDYLFKDEKAAFITSLLFISMISVGAPFWVYALSWIPILCLFLIKTMDFDEKYVIFSFISSILFILQFLSGGIFIFYFTSLFLVLPIFIWGIRKSIKKTVISGIIFSLMFFGFCSIKILPFLEWSSLINRAQGLGLKESMGSTLSLSNFFSFLVLGDQTYQLGVVGFFLFFIGIYFVFKKREKYTFLFFAILIINLLFSFGVLYSLWWRFIPGLAMQRGVTRSLFIFGFVGILFSGYGFKQVKLFSKPILFGLISFLIIMNVFLFSAYEKPNMEPFEKVYSNNQLISYLDNQTGVFRIKSNEVRGIDWNDIEMATVPLGIEDTSQAFGGFWFNDYLHGFMSLVYSGDQAKFLGILNVKYLTSSIELKDQGFHLVQKFEEDPEAIPDYMDGPYLYENDKFLPRAYQPASTFLVVGDEEKNKRIIQSLLLQEFIDPAKVTIVRGNKKLIKDYSIDFLNNFDAIILSEGSIEGYVPPKLKRYEGSIFPDLLNNKNSFTLDDISSVISAGKIVPLKFSRSQNEFNVTGKMVVLSERFSMFPGWVVKNHNVELFQANGINTFFILPKEDSVTLEYLPESFIKGKVILYLTIIILVVVFGYILYKKKKNVSEEVSPELVFEEGDKKPSENL